MEAYEHLVLDLSALTGPGTGEALDGLAGAPSTDLDIGPGSADTVMRGGPDTGVEPNRDSRLVRSEVLTFAEAREVSRAPLVLAVEPLPIVGISSGADVVVGTPPGRTSWGLDAIGVGASHLDGAGVTVAVLDCGIDDTHPAFAGVQVEHSVFVAPEKAVDGNHGTHCAGTILGRDVDGVRIGVARGVARLLDARVVGGTTTDVFHAVVWALRQGAHVISMSLGVDFPGFVERLERDGLPRLVAISRALAAYDRTLEAFDSLASVGQSAGSAVLVAAAGNGSDRAAPTPFVLDCEPPASAKDIVAVGAIGRGVGGALRPYRRSNQGVAIAAPGEEIWSAGPGGTLVADSGTSAAVPHVAGVAALLAQQMLEQEGVVTPALLRSRLLGSARPVPGYGVADVGAGLVCAPV